MSRGHESNRRQTIQPCATVVDGELSGRIPTRPTDHERRWSRADGHPVGGGQLGRPSGSRRCRTGPGWCPCHLVSPSPHSSAQNHVGPGFDPVGVGDGPHIGGCAHYHCFSGIPGAAHRALLQRWMDRGFSDLHRHLVWNLFLRRGRVECGDHRCLRVGVVHRRGAWWP